MPELVIADTSCLIALSRIDGFGLLEGLFSTVWTTDAVAEEFGRPMPPWIKVRITSESMALRMLAFNVDRAKHRRSPLPLSTPAAPSSGMTGRRG